MNNRFPWLSNNDYVLIDPEWFDGAEYRSRKSLNEFILDDALRVGQLMINHVSSQGQSLRLLPVPESMQVWSRKFPLKVTIAHHSKTHPVIFSSRKITFN